LIFRGLNFERFPNGSCKARVRLEKPDETEVVGEARGSASETGILRCAAEASIEAVELSIEKTGHFELGGVKAIHAFDCTIVIVSLNVGQEGGRRRRFVGTYVVNESLEHAAAVAVLNATNRYIGGHTFSRTL